jgi:hypothetical protein
VKWLFRPFTVTLVLTAVMLGVLVAYGVSGGVKTLGSGLLLGGFAIFLLMRGALALFVRRHAAEVPVASLLSVPESRVLATGYFTSAVLFLMAALLGGERLWSWVGVVGSAWLGWTYFVVSRGAME